MKLYILLTSILFFYSGLSAQNQCPGGDDRGNFGCVLLSLFVDKTHGTPFNIPRVHAVDPNEILGEIGYDTAQWVSINDNLGYTIFFENDPEFATAPAQVVEIRLPVHENLNIYSVRLSDFGFGFFNFSVPPNTTFYQERLDVLDSLDVYVDVTAGIDVVTNEVFWIFESIDSVTGLPPEDALTGFLPVNDTTTLYNDTIPKKGEGYVSYTIRPNSTLMTGDTVKGQASIVFDINAPIETNTWVNLVDAFGPTSHIDTIIQQPGSYQLVFSGNDDPGGVGLDYYDLYVSKDSGAFLLLEEKIDTSIYDFVGVHGSTYSFYTRAYDYVGNPEEEKIIGDTTITFLLGCISELAFNNYTVASGIYQSTGDLTAENTLVPNGTVVEFTSDTGILLNYDFEVELGATFEAYIQGCLNSLEDEDEEKKNE